MAVGMRSKLGMSLQNIVAGDQPGWAPPMPGTIPQTLPQNRMDVLSGAPKPQGGGFFHEGGMGRYLAGAIGDALLQNAGMKPVFAPAMQAKQEDVQWSRRKQAELHQQMALKAWEYANKPKEPTALENDTNAYMAMDAPHRQAYDAMHPIFRTGPDGLPYPTARPSPLIPPAAGVTFTPIPAPSGGGVGNGPGGFRR